MVGEANFDRDGFASGLQLGAGGAEHLGGALDAWPVVTGPADAFAPFEGLDAAEVFRTSGAELKVGGDAVTVEVRLADHPKCARSWRRVPDVGSDPAYPDLSARDADAVRAWDSART